MVTVKEHPRRLPSGVTVTVKLHERGLPARNVRSAKDDVIRKYVREQDRIQTERFMQAKGDVYTWADVKDWDEEGNLYDKDNNRINKLDVVAMLEDYILDMTSYDLGEIEIDETSGQISDYDTGEVLESVDIDGLISDYVYDMQKSAKHMKWKWDEEEERSVEA